MKIQFAHVLVGTALVFVPLVIGAAFGNPNQRVQRHGWVIMVKPEKIEEYKRLHAAVWPGVLNKLRECNVRNYSIYVKELEHGKFYLFSYLEYIGTDFDGDMAKMAADPETQRWWDVTKPCQQQISLHGENEWWSTMDEAFHME